MSLLKLYKVACLKGVLLMWYYNDNDIRLEIAQNIIIALINNNKIMPDKIEEYFKKFYKMVDDCMISQLNKQTMIVNNELTMPKYYETKGNKK